ncbi:carbohydrate ABC transporter permease [Paenarthrobacter sp. OM7]|uniref:Carbohydrate ABC transporter permease n=1 Tax=Paenarthrobacter sp. AMU7 TaxID=3162492 RepID=A0AB39YNN7_9MICC|nr:carbohydrate ABC transporter permease [Paenarthrobacter sp. OM7]WGM20486.1 carbohydrate ABC transporter permease [Paenarthrobacter sp. OM7]
MLVTLTLAAVAFVMMSPFIWTLMAATKPTNVAFTNPPQFIYEPTVDAFINLWETTDFYQYTLNTVIVGLLSVVGTLLLAAPAAYSLSRYGGKISTVILAFALLIQAVPGFAIMLPFYEIATSLGLYDTKIGLTLAFVAVNLPFTIWLLRNFFASISPDLDEAAMVDGCSRWGAFRRVILPVMQPGLVTASMLTFLLAFQSYLLPVVLTDVNSQTVPVFLSTQLGQSLPLLQQASAGVVLLTLPVMALALVAQKYLVAGLTAGSVKG